MPELPDLEIFSNNLNKRLSGKIVTEVTAYKTKRFNVTLETLNHELKNTTLSEVKRVGKGIHFLFSSQQVLEVHLMLKGGFDIVRDEAGIKYKIFSLHFEDGESLVISDSESLVKLTLNPTLSSVPDALEVTLDYLKAQLKKKKSKKIKAFLIDQTIVRGIGNAYVDEILWESRIAPVSLCGKIPEETVNGLFNAIKAVLTNAIEEIKGHQPDLLKGEYRDFLKIHNRKNRLSPTGQAIHYAKIASKTTYYSDDQQLYE